MSLIIIKTLFPYSINKWINYVSNLQDERYNLGVKIAQETDFDINKLKHKIYNICELEEK